MRQLLFGSSQSVSTPVPRVIPSLHNSYETGSESAWCISVTIKILISTQELKTGAVSITAVQGNFEVAGSEYRTVTSLSELRTASKISPGNACSQITAADISWIKRILMIYIKVRGDEHINLLARYLTKNNLKPKDIEDEDNDYRYIGNRSRHCQNPS